MTKITAVRSCTLRIPLDQATSISTRRVLGREFALVEIGADDGHKGFGFTYGGNIADSIVRTRLAREMSGEGLKSLAAGDQRQYLCSGRKSAASNSSVELRTEAEISCHLKN